MFREERQTSQFKWEDLGDLAIGRPNLGPECSLALYRLMQYTLRDELILQFGPAKANEVVYRAGVTAGRRFYAHLVKPGQELGAFLAETQKILKDLKVGILRMERHDARTGEMVVTVEEDLDCSGLPVSEETVCTWDEGFLAGLIETYTGKPYQAQEVDCWATGARICRFEIRPLPGA